MFLSHQGPVAEKPNYQAYEAMESHEARLFLKTCYLYLGGKNTEDLPDITKVEQAHKLTLGQLPSRTLRYNHSLLYIILRSSS